jgi:hypothetical protein
MLEIGSRKAQSFRKSAKFWTKAQDLGTAQDFRESAQFWKSAHFVAEA